ncbi:hypothetical protein AAVH_05047 [Aphelenchoides avenae]|nr:hypothetical protein AAVH_05047 [Aphelenchus avenae]
MGTHHNINFALLSDRVDHLTAWHKLDELRNRQRILLSEIADGRNEVTRMQGEKMRLLFDCSRLNAECSQREAEYALNRQQEEQLIGTLKSAANNSAPQLPLNSNSGTQSAAAAPSTEAVCKAEVNEQPMTFITSSSSACGDYEAVNDFEALITGECSSPNTVAAPVTTALKHPITDKGKDSAPPAKRLNKKMEEVGFDELRGHILNLRNLADCPVCERTLSSKRYNAVRHLVDHLGDKAYHPFKCTSEGCSFTSTQLAHVQGHVKAVHKLEWTEELKLMSVHVENKAAIEALMKEGK